MKKVDIIIPVHNRWEHTRQTLLSLIQNTNQDLYNLYVVNDCSDRETTFALGEFMMKSTVSFDLTTNTENIGPGASRNWVCNMITEKQRRSEFLYHSDNDVYFTDKWLEILLAAFMSADRITGNKIKLLGASCHPYLQSSERVPISVGYVGIKDAVSGYSQLMTWETWDKYGPFDETMRGAEEKIMGSEDWAFCQKIIKDGYKVGSTEPEVVIPCGKTNTYGKPATGIETFKEYPGVLVK